MEGTVHPGSIVVGIDTSGASLAALDWATAEAQLTRSPLHLIAAASPDQAEVEWGMGSSYDAVRRSGDQLLARAYNRVQLRDKAIEVSRSHPESYPAAPLIRASRDARMVVLGAHGESLMHLSGGLGATALQVAAHAACPVAIIRKDHLHSSQFQRVVVGVDAIGAENALSWGFEQAEHTSSELAVIHAWQPRDARDPGLRRGASWEDYAALRETAIREHVSGQQASHPDVKVRTDVVQGNPAKALVAQSQGSDVVVVGPRGSGGFAGLELGHVALSLLQHSGCPVVIAR